MKYIKYVIEKRLYSSNVVVGIYLTKNDKEKEVEIRDKLLSPYLTKSEGDKLSENLCEVLNSQINANRS